MKPRSVEERFWQCVEPGAPDECWPWTGGRNDRGYGYLAHVGGAKMPHRLAHRVSYELDRKRVRRSRR